MFFACMLFVNLELAQSILPGIPSSLYGNIIGQSDFEVNLRPPEEHEQDIKQTLASLMNLESEKHAESLGNYARDKQHMLNQEKSAIHDLVEGAFAPIRTKLKMQ